MSSGPQTNALRHRLRSILVVSALLGLPGEVAAEADAGSGAAVRCDSDDGGLLLPEGLCALVVADDLGPGRHLAVNGNGDVYLRLRRESAGGSIVALRDGDGDGRADVVARFGDEGGTGIEIRNGHLYTGTDTAILRWRLEPGELVPPGSPEVFIDGFPDQRQHAAKSFAWDAEGRIHVNVGAPSNACQELERSRGSPGIDPCPQLDRQAGVWRFPGDRMRQTQARDGKRFATGIRGVIAIAWNPSANRLYGVQHGRDSLHAFWPSLFTAKESAELPAEELIELQEQDDFGWPYCYYDHHQGRKVLAPEYGGDGKKIGRCERAKDPVFGLPAHWAPNDMIFYQGQLLGERYRNGAFIAFHGSWDRAPFEQQGYQVAFVPFDGARPTGELETFADGFKSKKTIRGSSEARFRPVGLAEGPDGSLYISDSHQGRIWRVIRRDGKMHPPESLADHVDAGRVSTTKTHRPKAGTADASQTAGRFVT